MITDQRLVAEINAKHDLIEENPGFYLKLNSKAVANIQNYSKVYSWWIEHPDIRKEVLIENMDAQTRGKLISIARGGIEKLHEAWKYIKSVDNPLNGEVLVNLSKIVCPEDNPQAGYRLCRVSLGLDYTPPNPIRVPDRIIAAFAELNAIHMHPVEKAVKAHLYIAGIQPFQNGNKRIARLVQDKILHSAGLPPAMIQPGERKIYIDLLERGLLGWRDDKPLMQKDFFNYVAGKVNSSLDEIIGDLDIQDYDRRLKKMRSKANHRLDKEIRRENKNAAIRPYTF